MKFAPTSSLFPTVSGSGDFSDFAYFEIGASIEVANFDTYIKTLLTECIVKPWLAPNYSPRLER